MNPRCYVDDIVRSTRGWYNYGMGRAKWQYYYIEPPGLLYIASLEHVH